MINLPKIEVNFPFKTLTPIVGEPTYTSINEITQQLYTNDSSCTSTLGGGNHGHLGLVMKPSLYKTITKTVFKFPEDPGPSPNINNDKNGNPRGNSKQMER